MREPRTPTDRGTERSTRAPETGARRAAPLARLQRAAGNRAVSAALAPDRFEREADAVADRLAGRPAGELLSAFGPAVGGVRLHGGGAAARAVGGVGAHAVTRGRDVAFRDGVPDTATRSGRALLAHELTHVVQQSGGGTVAAVPVAATAAPVTQAKFDTARVEEVRQSLGITGVIRAIEVPKSPKKAKATAPLSSYAPENKLDLTPQQEDMAMIELMYPDWKTEFEQDSIDYFDEAGANGIVDGLGGGAYNADKDLVVLGENFPDPALVHELGHKAQAEAGWTAATGGSVLLEYQNVIGQQNADWAHKKTDVKPRLQYAAQISGQKLKTALKVMNPAGVTDEAWTKFGEAVKAEMHHDFPAAVPLLKAIGTSLQLRYPEEQEKGVPYDKVVKYNVMAEWYATQ